MANPPKVIDDQFFADRVTVNPQTGCHEWRLNLNCGGYGTLKHKQKRWSAHRFAWAYKNGKIPDGKIVCHHCDNRKCINPEHLFLGTTQDNVNDKMQKNRFKPSRGESNGYAKLSGQAVAAIRKDPRPQRRIAQEYGISQANVSLIKNNKGWAHIEGNSHD